MKTGPNANPARNRAVPSQGMLSFDVCVSAIPAGQRRANPRTGRLLAGRHDVGFNAEHHPAPLRVIADLSAINCAVQIFGRCHRRYAEQAVIGGGLRLAVTDVAAGVEAVPRPGSRKVGGLRAALQSSAEKGQGRMRASDFSQ